MGSKAKFAKEILNIILRYRTKDMVYVEPFVGGANMIRCVPQGAGRIANDANHYLIALLKHIQAGGQVPGNKIMTREYFEYIRSNKDKVEPWLAGYVNISGVGEGIDNGYCHNDGHCQNYYDTRARQFVKDAPYIQGIEFHSTDYFNVPLPEKSCLIYCDPPYANTTEYVDKFDHKIFWEWAKQKTLEGHKVFVSEYTAPENWMCIWKKETKCTIANSAHALKAVEKLFVLKA